MDVISKLQQLIDERGWSTYRLAKECSLPEATVGNIFRRGTVPTIGTLEIICKGLGLTLSEFFADGDTITLTPDTKAVVDLWLGLTPAQREVALVILSSIKKL